MGLSIVFTGIDDEGCGYPFELASATDWNRLHSWLKRLPRDQMPILRKLARTGQVKDTLALRQEIEGCPVQPTDRPAIASALFGVLLDRIGHGDPAETAIILGDD